MSKWKKRREGVTSGVGDPYHPRLSAPVLCTLEDTVLGKANVTNGKHGSGYMRHLKCSSSWIPEDNGIYRSRVREGK